MDMELIASGYHDAMHGQHPKPTVVDIRLLHQHIYERQEFILPLHFCR